VFDVANSEEVSVIADGAGAFARVLVEIESDTPDLVVKNLAWIEIFNEIDAANVANTGTIDAVSQATAELSASRWADAWLQVALAMQGVFEAAGLSIPFRLPGLGSWSPSATKRQLTWEYRARWFYRSFLEHLVARAPAIGVDLSTLRVSGLDYHWYHHRPKSGTIPSDRLHIAYLVRELQFLRRILDANGFSDAELSVFESDTSSEAMDPSASTPAFWFPAGVVTAADRERFQAQEVWRRLGGAFAGGATVAGWHPWITGLTAGYFQAGLRSDFNSATGKRAGLDSPASVAVPKLAWHSFGRMSSLLARATSARMIAPSVAPSSPLGAKGKHGLRENVVIVEFSLHDHKHPYGYLILIDPTGKLRKARVLRSGKDKVELRGTLPKTTTLTSAGGAVNLPQASATWEHRTTTDRVFKLVRGGDPVFFLAPTVQSFTVVHSLP
jgi:hypothetical protein